MVTDLLGAQGVENAAAIAALAGGSMASAVLLSDPEASARRDEFVSRAMTALTARDLGPALELAEEAKKTKEGLDTRILALAARLAERALAAARDGRAGAEADATRYGLALDAVEQLDGNAGAQFVVESMLARMRGARS